MRANAPEKKRPYCYSQVDVETKGRDFESMKKSEAPTRDPLTDLLHVSPETILKGFDFFTTIKDIASFASGDKLAFDVSPDNIIRVGKRKYALIDGILYPVTRESSTFLSDGLHSETYIRPHGVPIENFY